MSVRQLCKETARPPVKALFYFPDERKTGIAPTRVIVEKDVNIDEGIMVTVNWAGKKVPAEILAVNGKCNLNLLVFVTSLNRIEPSKN